MAKSPRSVVKWGDCTRCSGRSNYPQRRGTRPTARVFEVDPNTVLQWLVEAAEPLQAFARYFLCDVHVRQVQLDELYTVIRAVKDGALGKDEAIEHLSRSPHWVWAAMDPES